MIFIKRSIRLELLDQLEPWTLDPALLGPLDPAFLAALDWMSTLEILLGYWIFSMDHHAVHVYDTTLILLPIFCYFGSPAWKRPFLFWTFGYYQLHFDCRPFRPLPLVYIFISCDTVMPWNRQFACRRCFYRLVGRHLSKQPRMWMITVANLCS